MDTPPDPSPIVEIIPAAGIATERHGWRAKCLQRLIRMDLPVPRSLAISTEAVRGIAAGRMLAPEDLGRLIGPAGRLVGVRPSALNPEWGGPGTVLNVGLNDESHRRLAERLGDEAADALYRGFIQSYAIHVARLDPDMFSEPDATVRDALRAYRDETDEPFPQDP
ncbi:MAG TPA: pyruvate, phosphate dikinase, partial [Paracoccus sp. (in: a-proteobacteria)]|nr:pyruvate, phosphate dikinase [Paracoccus sp. (in: a-proteobacteria)]